MKARIPQHREFIINFPDTVDQAKANEGWAKLSRSSRTTRRTTTVLPSMHPTSSKTANLPSRSCRKSMASSTPLSM